MKIGPLGFKTILFASVFAAASWLLIHVFAVAGVFLAAAYPIWWLLSPVKPACLLCSGGRNGDKCFFCRKEINKSEGNSPANFTSALLNGALILFVTLLSVGVVFIESQVLFKSSLAAAEKTASFVIPDKAQYHLGEVFPLKIEINGIKNPINTIRADLSFDSDILSVEKVSTEGSFATIFVQNEVDNHAGFVRLSGGLPNPGYSADSGIFGTVYFRAKKSGTVKIEYLPSSRILANDGRGTDVLADLLSVSYIILPERVVEGGKNNTVSSPAPQVAGEKAQMKFYDEKDILGTNINAETQDDNGQGYMDPLLTGLKKFDEFIITYWSHAFR